MMCNKLKFSLETSAIYQVNYGNIMIRKYFLVFFFFYHANEIKTKSKYYEYLLIFKFPISYSVR